MNISTTITRPADITAYASGDVLNANGSTTPIEIEFTQATRNSHLLGISITSSNASGTPTFNVYVVRQSYTIAADNAAYAPSATELGYRLGEMLTTSTWTAKTNGKIADLKPNFPIALPDSNISSTSVGKLYLVIELGSAYTPTSGETFTITANIG